MLKNYQITEEVKAIGNLNLEGNIIPIEWFQHIKLDSGKPDTNSILILSDIVYWYRPTTIRDESTGRILGYKKKFKADLLQKSYKDLEEFFGLSRAQLKDALQRLEKKDLIKRIFRTISTASTTLNNVMFIQINPKKIKEITTKHNPMGKHTHTTEEISSPLCGNNPTPMENYHHTYTKTTTKTTTNSSLSELEKPKIDKKNNYSIQDFKDEREMIENWNKIIKQGIAPSKVTESRLIKLQKVLKDLFNNDLNEWNQYCHRVTQSKFLMGEITNFKASLDWCLNPEKIQKIQEGDYGVGDRTDQSFNVGTTSTEFEDHISNPLWKEARSHIIAKLGVATFKSWIAKIDFLEEKNGVIYLRAISKFVQQYVETHYKDIITFSWKQINPEIRDVTISFT